MVPSRIVSVRRDVMVGTVAKRMDLLSSEGGGGIIDEL